MTLNVCMCVPLLVASESAHLHCKIKKLFGKEEEETEEQKLKLHDGIQCRLANTFTFDFLLSACVESTISLSPTLHRDHQSSEQ